MYFIQFPYFPEIVSNNLSLTFPRIVSINLSLTFPDCLYQSIPHFSQDCLYQSIYAVLCKAAALLQIVPRMTNGSISKICSSRKIFLPHFS